MNNKNSLFCEKIVLRIAENRKKNWTIFYSNHRFCLSKHILLEVNLFHSTKRLNFSKNRCVRKTIWHHVICGNLKRWLHNHRYCSLCWKMSNQGINWRWLRTNSGSLKCCERANSPAQLSRKRLHFFCWFVSENSTPYSFEKDFNWVSNCFCFAVSL